MNQQRCHTYKHSLNHMIKKNPREAAFRLVLLLVCEFVFISCNTYSRNLYKEVTSKGVIIRKTVLSSIPGT